MYVLIKCEQQQNNNIVNEDVTYTYLAHGYVNVTSTTMFKYYISTANTNNAIIFSVSHMNALRDLQLPCIFFSSRVSI